VQAGTEGVALGRQAMQIAKQYAVPSGVPITE